MANKYSKSNNSSKAKEEKTMEDYRERQKKLNTGARIIAIILIAVMVIFAVVGSIWFML